MKSTTNDEATQSPLKSNIETDQSKSKQRTSFQKSAPRESPIIPSRNLKKKSIETVINKIHQEHSADSGKDCDGNAEDASSIKKDRKKSSRAVYDLYGAVMGVVEGHRKQRQAKESSRRQSQESRTISTPAQANGRKNQSFDISDDEDFSDASLHVSSKKKNSHNASRGVSSRLRRKSSNRAQEKALLGSNMDPTVCSEEERTKQVIHEHSENGKTNCAQELSKPEEKKREKVRTKTTARTKSVPKEKERKSEDAMNEHGETPKTRPSRRKNPVPQKKRKGAAAEEEEEEEEKWQPDELHRLQR